MCIKFVVVTKMKACMYATHFAFFLHITKELNVHLISVYKEIPHKMDIVMMVLQMTRIGRKEGREEGRKEGRERGREGNKNKYPSYLWLLFVKVCFFVKLHLSFLSCGQGGQ